MHMIICKLSLYTNTSLFYGLSVVYTYTYCNELGHINMKYVRNCISPADNRYSASASVINDLLLVKSK